MKTVIYVFLAGAMLGALLGVGILWMEFGGVEETFTYYSPDSLSAD